MLSKTLDYLTESLTWVLNPFLSLSAFKEYSQPLIANFIYNLFEEDSLLIWKNSGLSHSVNDLATKSFSLSPSLQGIFSTTDCQFHLVFEEDSMLIW